MNLITDEYICNTFSVKFNSSCGTGFRPIKTNNYSYIVTANHVIPELQDNGEIYIYSKDGYKPVKVYKTLHNKEHDTSIIVIKEKSSVSFQHNIGSGNMTYSQDIFVLGFPLGINVQVGKIGGREHPIPIPFVKKGVLSTMTSLKCKFWYVGVHINQGFSGGPAIFWDVNDNKSKIFGVVSEFLPDEIDGDEIEANSGIGIVRDISIAKQMIVELQEDIGDKI